MGTRHHLEYEGLYRPQVLRRYHKTGKTGVIRKLYNRDPENQSGTFSLKKGISHRSGRALPSILGRTVDFGIPGADPHPVMGL